MESHARHVGRSETEKAFLDASPGTPDDAAIAELLAQRVRDAQTKWPHAHVADIEFARELGRATGEGSVDVLDGIDTDDLYLKCGCLAGDKASVAHLSDLVRRGASKWASGIQIDADDLAQRVLTRLLVPSDDAPPRLARYEARAPLVAYLKTVTRNLAVSTVRGADQAAATPATPAPSALFAAIGDPEHDAMRLELGEAFSRALDESFRALEGRQRAVIAMHYADGAEVDAIAKVYRVHRVTVSRWLADAREQVFDATRKRLRSSLGLTESEFESALQIIRSQIDISLSTLATAP